MAAETLADLLAIEAPWQYIPHEPTDHQWAAMMFEQRREVLYGGAAGGGKSDWLLMEALRYVDVPGYAALILRRTYPQLAQADGLIPRACDWLIGKPGVKWSKGDSTFTFASGSTLAFGHVQYEKDKYNYQGGAYQFIGFDELTQFPQSVYTYLFSRNRRPNDSSRLLSSIPLRMRAASNPGGEGHDWVRERFLLNSAKQRIFFPAKLEDNPYLDAESYTQSLMELHPYERAQLLNGDWDARPPGSRFKREWIDTYHEVPPPKVVRRVRRWDLAATEPKPGKDPDWTAGTLMSRTPQGKSVVEDVQRFRGDPGTVDARLRAQAEMDGRGAAIRIEQEPGSSGKIAAAHFRRLLAGFDVRCIPSTGDKVVRFNPFASAAHEGDVECVRGPWLEEWLRELESFPNGSHDDQADATSGAYADTAIQRGLSPSDLYGEDADAVHP